MHKLVVMNALGHLVAQPLSSLRVVDIQNRAFSRDPVVRSQPIVLVKDVGDPVTDQFAHTALRESQQHNVRTLGTAVVMESQHFSQWIGAIAWKTWVLAHALATETSLAFTAKIESSIYLIVVRQFLSHRAPIWGTAVVKVWRQACLKTMAKLLARVLAMMVTVVTVVNSLGSDIAAVKSRMEVVHDRLTSPHAGFKGEVNCGGGNDEVPQRFLSSIPIWCYEMRHKAH